MPARQRCSVVIADDHQIVRDGLRALLSQQSDLELVGEAETGRELLARVRQVKPAVVVMDISMPDLNGIEAARQLHDISPDTKIVALSMHVDRRMISAMLSAGARGYIPKDAAFDEVAQAIRQVAAGRTYLSPSIADVVVEGYVQQTAVDDSSVFAVLSPREREVLQLVAEGQGTRGIAERLHISVKTVETHRRQIMGKLNLHTVPELTKYAIREGLTSLES